MKRIKDTHKRHQFDASKTYDTNYKKYVSLVREEVWKMHRDVDSSNRHLNRDVSRAKTDLKRGIINPNRRDYSKKIISLGDRIRNTYSTDYMQMKSMEDDIADPLSSSHLFLIGPATSESLFRFKPEDYHFIKNGMVPFDNCYFELIDSIDVKLPGIEVDASIEGIQMSHRGNDERNYLEKLLREGQISKKDFEEE